MVTLLSGCGTRSTFSKPVSTKECATLHEGKGYTYSLPKTTCLLSVTYSIERIGFRKNGRENYLSVPVVRIAKPPTFTVANTVDVLETYRVSGELVEDSFWYSRSYTLGFTEFGVLTAANHTATDETAKTITAAAETLVNIAAIAAAAGPTPLTLDSLKTHRKNTTEEVEKKQKSISKRRNLISTRYEVIESLNSGFIAAGTDLNNAKDTMDKAILEAKAAEDLQAKSPSPGNADNAAALKLAAAEATKIHDAAVTQVAIAKERLEAQAAISKSIELLKAEVKDIEEDIKDYLALNADLKEVQEVTRVYILEPPKGPAPLPLVAENASGFMGKETGSELAWVTPTVSLSYAESDIRVPQVGICFQRPGVMSTKPIKEVPGLLFRRPFQSKYQILQEIVRDNAVTSEWEVVQSGFQDVSQYGRYELVPFESKNWGALTTEATFAGNGSLTKISVTAGAAATSLSDAAKSVGASASKINDHLVGQEKAQALEKKNKLDAEFQEIDAELKLLKKKEELKKFKENPAGEAAE